MGTGARLRLWPDRPRPRPPRDARRLPLRDGDLLQPLGLLGRLAGTLRGTQELPRHPRQRDLPPDRAELLRLHGHCPHLQDGPGRLARHAPLAQPPVQARDPRRGAAALRHPHRALDPGLVVDVRLALQRGQLDGHPAPSDQPARAQLARAVGLRHGRRHHRQCLARAALLRHHRAGGSGGRASRVSGGGRGGRGELVGPLLARHAAPHQARARRGHPLLDDLHLRGLQHRAGPDARRSRQHHAPLRHPRLPGRPPGRQPRPGRGDLAVHLSAPRAGRLLPAPLHPEGVAVASASSRGARIRSDAFAYMNLVPFIFFVMFPFYFMAVTSFKSNAELYNLKSVPFVVKAPIVDHYTFLFLRTDFFVWMKNSLLVAVVATVASVTIAILAGYSLARLRFRGAGSFGTAVFITYLVPPTLLFLPLSQVVVWLGLADSVAALMITYPTFLVPFCTWLLMGYFRTIPREVEECALVDGATRMQTLRKVVLPMAVPGIICAVLFSFTLCWNEFTYALTFISQSAHKTAVVGVTSDLIRGDIYFWGSLMAGALIASIPIVIVYVLFLDYYVSGLTAGAVKG